jgi:cytochrome oxidase Cu insertion factor (SCO1/SenC/PrrC family)
MPTLKGVVNMKNIGVLLITGMVLIVLAACGGGTAVSEPTVGENGGGNTAVIAAEPMPDHTDDMTMEDESKQTMSEQNDTMTAVETGTESTDGEMTESSMDAMAELPTWQTLPLIDANSGQTFTLSDLAGKTVFVEPMATWCTNCRQQLGNVAQIRQQFGDDVVFIGLSLETNLNPADLAAYATNQGFDWTFAVMTPEMLQALADTFGRTITNAPSTPHFIIRANGSYTDLITGIDSPDQLVRFIQDAQS